MTTADVDPGMAATIGRIADSVEKGECILFLGAAVHARPPDDSPYTYAEEVRPPLGKTFAKQLAETSGFLERFPDESDEDLQRVALHYEDAIGRKDLVDQIDQAVQAGKQPSPVVRALAAMPFPITLTTNYDLHFETALRDLEERKDPRVVVYTKKENVRTPDHGAATPDAPLVLKLHGDVRHVDDIVITDEDYIQFILRMNDKDAYNPIPMQVRWRFTAWPTLFVGYSLVDYNLRLLFKTLRWGVDTASMPSAWSVDVSPDPLIVAIWQDRQGYVRYIVQDVWEFVPELYRRTMGKEMPT
jgi:SIR2-like domain